MLTNPLYRMREGGRGGEGNNEMEWLGDMNFESSRIDQSLLSSDLSHTNVNGRFFSYM